MNEPNPRDGTPTGAGAKAGGAAPDAVDPRAAGEELNFVLRARREKLDALLQRGVEPFAYSFDRSHTTADALRAYAESGVDGDADGPAVRVAGRLVSWRAQG